MIGIGLKYLSKMSAIVQAYNRSPSRNCKASDDWKKKKNRTWNWHWFMPIVVEDDIIFFHFFWWHTDLCFETYHFVHLKAKVCIQDQMTIAYIDKENCISTSPFLLYSWKMPLCYSIMVIVLDSGWRGLGLRPSTGLAWSFCCVLWQTTIFSQCVSLPRSINRYRPIVREVR